MRFPPEEGYVHRWYVRWIRPHIRQEIDQQRLKLIWDLWGYVPLLTLPRLSFLARLPALIARFLMVDWYVVHCHKPYEIAIICRMLANRRARPTRSFWKLDAGMAAALPSSVSSAACSATGSISMLTIEGRRNRGQPRRKGEATTSPVSTLRQ